MFIGCIKFYECTQELKFITQGFIFYAFPNTFSLKKSISYSLLVFHGLSAMSALFRDLIQG